MPSVRDCSGNMVDSEGQGPSRALSVGASLSWHPGPFLTLNTGVNEMKTPTLLPSAASHRRLRPHGGSGIWAGSPASADA